MAWDDELRECVGVVLGVEPPEGELRTWLGARNLGLVPIADPAEFSWPGHWIARSGDHAVVMFGSPSGPLDPERAPETIDEGWLLARLDVRLPIEEPYGRAASTGSVVALLVAPDAEEPLRRVESVEAVAGRGLVGDRYHDRRGTFGRNGGLGYEVTLVEAEAFDEIDLPWEQGRRNVVTRGISLNALVGKHFRVGEVELVGRRLAEPCAHLERLARPGIMRPLVHRAGLRADIVSGGTISVGDPVAADSH